MAHHESSALEQVRKLVAGNPALQRQLQESADMSAALETIQQFAQRLEGGADMDQIAAGLQQARQACNVGGPLCDEELEAVAAGADGMQIFLSIISLGITCLIDESVEQRRREASGYGG